MSRFKKKKLQRCSKVLEHLKEAQTFYVFLSGKKNINISEYYFQNNIKNESLIQKT